LARHIYLDFSRIIVSTALRDEHDHACSLLDDGFVHVCEARAHAVWLLDDGVFGYSHQESKLIYGHDVVNSAVWQSWPHGIVKSLMFQLRREENNLPSIRDISKSGNLILSRSNPQRPQCSCP
jgi:hypothetical protein